VKNDVSKTKAIGFDIGTSRIVTARQADAGIQYNVQLNGFVGIPYSKMAAKMLEKESVPHAVAGDEILVHGNESERFADLLDKDIRRTMTRGILNPDEPESIRFIREIAASMVGAGSQNQLLCFSVPAAPLGSEESLTYHEATLRAVFSDLGYSVKSINEGLAVVYAEMESTNYTGIGISCGGGLCNVCLSYLSVPVFSFSIPKAGDFIDNSAASVTGERANRIRIYKEKSFHINGHYEDKVKQALGVYYDDMIQTLVAGMRSAFLQARKLPNLSKPVPLVLSGGTAMPGGFRDRFERTLRESSFPIELSEIRMAAEPLTATAKGALVAALCD
jgi:hypothetical protein